LAGSGKKRRHNSKTRHAQDATSHADANRRARAEGFGELKLHLSNQFVHSFYQFENRCGRPPVLPLCLGHHRQNTRLNHGNQCYNVRFEFPESRLLLTRRSDALQGNHRYDPLAISDGEDDTIHTRWDYGTSPMYDISNINCVC
jgi:hypothetical protein